MCAFPQALFSLFPLEAEIIERSSSEIMMEGWALPQQDLCILYLQFFPFKDFLQFQNLSARCTFHILRNHSWWAAQLMKGTEKQACKPQSYFCSQLRPTHPLWVNIRILEILYVATSKKYEKAGNTTWHSHWTGGEGWWPHLWGLNGSHLAAAHHSPPCWCWPLTMLMLTIDNADADLRT